MKHGVKSSTIHDAGRTIEAWEVDVVVSADDDEVLVAVEVDAGTDERIVDVTEGNEGELSVVVSIDTIVVV